MREVEILVQPMEGTQSGSLKALYDKALAEAAELYILSAYLTEWKPSTRLNPKCAEFCFIVGKDFGITRKDACRRVLRWLPKDRKNDFRVAEGISGFHPKILMWKTESGKPRLVIGSSNLTQAGVTTNYEANVSGAISRSEFDSIRNWIDGIRSRSKTISDDWLNLYKEAHRSPRSRKRVMRFNLPNGRDIEEVILRRRVQLQAFGAIKKALTQLIGKCASRSISDKRFYKNLMDLWGRHESRFQGRGFERTGRNSKWHEVCLSLKTILDNGDSIRVFALDNLVKREIDGLARKGNPNRKAWLSEMLCHYFPDRFPIVNEPIKHWLRHSRYRWTGGASEGAKYIDLATELRQAIKTNTVNSAKNLAELDHAIWKWHTNMGGKSRLKSKAGKTKRPKK